MPDIVIDLNKDLKCLQQQVSKTALRHACAQQRTMSGCSGAAETTIML
jgi:hypothetical protein